MLGINKETIKKTVIEEINNDLAVQDHLAVLIMKRIAANESYRAYMRELLK